MDLSNWLHDKVKIWWDALTEGGTYIDETYKGLDKKIKFKRFDILQRGIARITRKICELLPKKSKTITAAATLIVASNCDFNSFRDATLALEESSNVLYLLTASNFSLEDDWINKTCEMIRHSYGNASHFLRSCIKSDDEFYKKTGIMIQKSQGIVQRFCLEKQYREKILEDTKCGLKEQSACFERSKKKLLFYGLLPGDMGQEGRQEIKILGNVRDICCIVENVEHCTMKARKDKGCTKGTFNQEFDKNQENIMDNSCKKYVIATCLSNASTVMPSLVMALYYLGISSLAIFYR